MAKIRKIQCRRRDGSPSGTVAWLVDWRDPLTGKRHNRQFAKRGLAEDHLRDIHARIERGRRTADSRATLSDVYQLWSTWLDAEVASGAMTWGTAGDYRGKMAHVLPRVGALRMAQIEPATIHHLRDQLVADGVSLAMTRKIITTLSQLFSWAGQRGITSANPCSDVRVRVPKNRVTPPSREVVQELLDKCEPGRWRGLFLTLAFTGMRAGEALALEWSDVDFDSGVIRVSKSCDGRGGTKDPKTAAGLRDVPMAPIVANTLRTLPRRGDHVFANDRGGLASVNNVGKKWRQIAGGACRMHDLRHFAVSLWAAQGIPIVAVSRYVGHANPTITLGTYAHFFEEDAHREQIAEAASWLRPVSEVQAG